MSGTLADVFEEVKKLAGLSYEASARVAFLRNFTVEGIEPYLKLHLFRSGVRPELCFCDYGVLHQELLTPSGQLHGFSPEIIVIALYLDNFDPQNRNTGWRHEDAKARLADLFGLAAKSTNAVIGVNTFVPPFASDGGIGGAAVGANRNTQIALLNGFIRDYVAGNPGRFFLSDWESIAQRLGEEASMDYRFWYMSKAPFKKGFLDQFASDISAAGRALKGKAKKCLVLDCDNTLWGGIVGEDGKDGIKLDPDSYPGKAFHDFQKSVLKLHDRGVILAINSKNNEDDVWQAMEHPHSLLKKTHFAAAKINWQDKVTNLNALAKELNLGLDSFVFVDDNPRECEFVKASLPQVTVLPVPASLFLLPQLLERGGWFDTLSVSEEDRNRTKMYLADKDRGIARDSSASVEEYLSQLGMTALIHEITPAEIARVAQLTQKTNQFNLTTRRYSEPQIEQLQRGPDSKVFSLSVKDKFGDLGLTGVLIARRDGEICRIDSLLLSCRILGRSLELAFVDHCLKRLQESWEPRKWAAEYVPTRKNEQVRDFWKNFGFDEELSQGSSVSFTLRAQDRVAKPVPYVQIQE